MNCARKAQAWRYWPTQADDAVETGTVQGLQVALPAHFHEEDQLIVVLQGRRRLVIGTDIFCAAAGQTLLVPAGVVHRSLAEAQDLLCVNAYLPLGRYHLQDLRQALAAAWQAGQLACREDVLVLLARYRLAGSALPSSESGRCALQIAPTSSVREAALAQGWSREHYARQFRRQHGVSPQTHRLLQRLNVARNHLRAGAPLAEVALEAGFTDQSHLSRAFKRVFGISPGCFRADWE